MQKPDLKVGDSAKAGRASWVRTSPSRASLAPTVSSPGAEISDRLRWHDTGVMETRVTTGRTSRVDALARISRIEPSRFRRVIRIFVTNPDTRF